MGRMKKQRNLRIVKEQEARQAGGNMEYIIPEKARARLLLAFQQKENIVAQFEGAVQLVFDSMGIEGTVTNVDLLKGTVTTVDDGTVSRLPTQEELDAAETKEDS